MNDMEGEATGAVSSVIAAFVLLGPGGLFCIPLMGWIFLQHRQIRAQNDKLFEIGMASVAANTNSANANNRLADMLAVRRNPEG